MNHPAFSIDPRLMASAIVQQQQHSLRASQATRADEAKEVANFLLQLKHKNVQQVPVHHSLSQLEAARLPLQHSQATRAAQLHKLPLPYPVGSLYGYPSRLEQALLERSAVANPNVMLDRERALLAAERGPVLLDDTPNSDTSWERLLDGSDLVLMKDRDLVPDALFVAMAQMKACKLTQADRVGFVQGAAQDPRPHREEHSERPPDKPREAGGKARDPSGSRLVSLRCISV